MLRILSVVVLAATLTGCAFSEQTVDVPYTAASAAAIPNAQPVALRVVDGRESDRNRISTKMNGFGMDAADIHSSRPVADIVQDALTQEFRQRGFGLAANGYPLTVTINTFFNQFGTGLFQGTSEGSVVLGVTVTTGAGVSLYTHSYEGHSTDKVMVAAGSNAAASVEAALHDAVDQMFSDQNLIQILITPMSAARPPES